MAPATRSLLPVALFAVATSACPTRAVDRFDAEWQAVEVPGLALSMPPWTVRETGAQWQFGRHVLDEPGGRERFMEVQWTLATPTKLEELVVLYGPDFQIASREVGTVAGGDATTLLLAAPASGKHVGVTSWRCVDDPRNFMLTSFLARAPADLLALHRRVLASVRCRPSPGGSPSSSRSIRSCCRGRRSGATVGPGPAPRATRRARPCASR